MAGSKCRTIPRVRSAASSLDKIVEDAEGEEEIVFRFDRDIESEMEELMDRDIEESLDKLVASPDGKVIEMIR